jgi:hypothetical protein
MESMVIGCDLRGLGDMLPITLFLPRVTERTRLGLAESRTLKKINRLIKFTTFAASASWVGYSEWKEQAKWLSDDVPIVAKVIYERSKDPYRCVTKFIDL